MPDRFLLYFPKNIYYKPYNSKFIFFLMYCRRALTIYLIHIRYITKDVSEKYITSFWNEIYLEKEVWMLWKKRKNARLSEVWKKY